MRLKQLLGCLVPLVLSAAATAAPATQLTDLRVLSQAGGTTVAIRTNGAFTHTEYRPADGLLLVDLLGVQPGLFANKKMNVDKLGVHSYRVQSFKSASGPGITRLEVTLDTRSVVKVAQKTNALLLSITAPADATPAAAADSTSQPEQEPATAKSAKPGAGSPSLRPVVIRGIAIQRRSDGLDVQLRSDRELSPHILKLSDPDRIVLDFAGAVPATRNRNISVNSDLVKAVRMARNQLDPPVTRVVVDLAAPGDYQESNTRGGYALHLMRSQTKTAALNSQPAQATVANVLTQVEPTATTPTTSTNDGSQNAIASSVISNSGSQGQPEQNALAAPAPVPAVNAKIVDAQTVNIKTADNPLVSAPAPPASAVPQVAASTQPVQVANANIAAKPLVTAAVSAPTNPLLAPAPVVPASAALQAQPAAVLQALQQAPAAPAAAQAVPAPDQAPATTTTACNSTRFTGEPISVNLKEVDLRDFFRLLHDISGLNVVLDPDVRGTLTIVLDDVPWDQALNIVMHNNRLDCELEGNVLRIASTATIRAEADARRAQVDAQALAVDKLTVTRYLSYATAAEVLPTIKTFLSQRGDIIADARTNSLIISDIPNVIPNIDNLIRQLDRKTPGVEIEARVVATTRSFARDIGTQFGFAFGNGNSTVSGAPIGNNTSPIQTPSLVPFYLQTAGQQAIPLFSNQPAANVNSGIGFANATRNYQIDFILSMAESRGLLKILSRPRIVTQNNIAGLIRQGVQVPVVTAAQLGGPPTTTYVNAFLRLQVKPQITAEGTVFLNIDVENTTPDFSQQVNGNPTLTTQQATTQVLVADGGTVVIGGVIATNSSVNTNEVPFLGELPVLGNLFKRRAVQTTTQELIFFITPKIMTS